MPIFLVPILSALLPVILPAVVKAVIPKVVKAAESEMGPGNGAEKKAWVLEFFTDVIEILESRKILSARSSAAIGVILPQLSDWIESAVKKLKRKDAI